VKTNENKEKRKEKEKRERRERKRRDRREKTRRYEKSPMTTATDPLEDKVKELQKPNYDLLEK